MAAGFSPKEDRMAQHVADTYGGTKRGLSIGYGVATKRRGMKKKRARGRKRNR